VFYLGEQRQQEGEAAHDLVGGADPVDLIRSRVRTLPMAKSVACGSPSPWSGNVKRATILVPAG
jgi:hypothetical protein